MPRPRPRPPRRRRFRAVPVEAGASGSPVSASTAWGSAVPASPLSAVAAPVAAAAGLEPPRPRPPRRRRRRALGVAPGSFAPSSIVAPGIRSVSPGWASRSISGSSAGGPAADPPAAVAGRDPPLPRPRPPRRRRRAAPAVRTEPGAVSEPGSGSDAVSPSCPGGPSGSMVTGAVSSVIRAPFERREARAVAGGPGRWTRGSGFANGRWTRSDADPNDRCARARRPLRRRAPAALHSARGNPVPAGRPPAACRAPSPGPAGPWPRLLILAGRSRGPDGRAPGGQTWSQDSRSTPPLLWHVRTSPYRPRGVGSRPHRNRAPAG